MHDLQFVYNYYLSHQAHHHQLQLQKQQHPHNYHPHHHKELLQTIHNYVRWKIIFSVRREEMEEKWGGEREEREKKSWITYEKG